MAFIRIRRRARFVGHRLSTAASCYPRRPIHIAPNAYFAKGGKDGKESSRIAAKPSDGAGRLRAFPSGDPADDNLHNARRSFRRHPGTVRASILGPQHILEIIPSTPVARLSRFTQPVPELSPEKRRMVVPSGRVRDRRCGRHCSVQATASSSGRAIPQFASRLMVHEPFPLVQSVGQHLPALSRAAPAVHFAVSLIDKTDVASARKAWRLSQFTLHRRPAAKGVPRLRRQTDREGSAENDAVGRHGTLPVVNAERFTPTHHPQDASNQKTRRCSHRSSEDLPRFP